MGVVPRRRRCIAVWIFIRKRFDSSLGFAQRYIGCSHPEVAHEGYFMICKQCNNAYELVQHTAIDAAIHAQAKHMGFAVETQMVELLGTCAACRAYA